MRSTHRTSVEVLKSSSAIWPRAAAPRLQVTVLATGPDAGLSMQLQDGVRVYRAGLANHYWHYTQQRPGRLARLGWHYRDRYNADMRQHVREVIQREQPEIVVSNNLTGWSISAWDEITAAGLPIVQVLHDLYLLCPKDTMFNHGKSCQRQCGLCSVFRLGHARASAQVATVIGVSRFVLERITAQGYFSRALSTWCTTARPSLPGRTASPSCAAAIRCASATSARFRRTRAWAG